MTSLQETWSIVAPEAMLHPKVCIAMNEAGIADCIIVGQNRFIYQVNNVNDLLEKIRYCFEYSGTLEHIGKNARATYLEHYSMDIFEKYVRKKL